MLSAANLVWPAESNNLKRMKTDVSPAPFKAFLRANKGLILIILLLALGVRIFFVWTARPIVNDALTRYIGTAINVLDGHGFSVDRQPPYRPSESVVPLYPLFIAAHYAVFGRHAVVVRVAQVLLDLFTCLLTAFVSFRLAPARLKTGAAISTLILYGIFSWFTAIWTSYLLTETLAIFLTMLVIALGIRAMDDGRRFWFYAGLACGLALLTRPDSALLAGGVVLFLAVRAVRRRSSGEALSAVLFSLAILVTLLPWIGRNYFTLGKFQPLASEYGSAQEAYMPTGYLWWIRTWMIDETYFSAFYPAFAPAGTTFFDPQELPESAFDSTGERERVEALFARYNQTRRFSPDLDAEFREIAGDRIRRAPFRFFLKLPVYRVASLWLTGFSTSNPLRRLLRILSVLPLIIGGVLGFAFWGRGQPLGALLLSIIITRTVFMGYHYAPETRYIVEVYPPLIAACGITVAFVWLRARSLRRAPAEDRLSLADP
jgi:4-amino-4-deoxy-L-arabinose transferase-like glycosyltransferase